MAQCVWKGGEWGKNGTVVEKECKEFREGGGREREVGDRVDECIMEDARSGGSSEEEGTGLEWKSPRTWTPTTLN